MKKCWNCWKYKAFYTKGYFKFNRENQGNCTKHEKIVGKHENCEYWGSNAISRKIRKSICLKALDEALSGLLEIKQILIEEQADN